MCVNLKEEFQYLQRRLHVRTPRHQSHSQIVGDFTPHFVIGAFVASEPSTPFFFPRTLKNLGGS